MLKYWIPLVIVLSGCVSTPESGRSALVLTSVATENSLGEQAYSQILSKERLSHNEHWKTILQRVGNRIATAANQPDFQWQFSLIESKEKNAFCLPGGKVAFYTGIFPLAVNEAGLAAVMGHEVAHATARHAGQRMTLAMGTQIGLGGLEMLLNGGGKRTDRQLLLAALGVGAQVGAILPFSRANEAEADEIGIIYMARAGYDPAAAPALWDRFAREVKGGPPKFLSTHPASEDRSRELQALLPKAQREYEKSPKYGLGETL